MSWCYGFTCLFRIIMNTLNIKTSKRNEFIDITNSIQNLLENQNIQEGACIIYVPHATWAVTINEWFDPDVRKDITTWLSKQIPKDNNFNHMEGNSVAHIKSSLIWVDQKVIIQNGQLFLWKWQKIFFCEFDWPRTRSIYVKFIN